MLFFVRVILCGQSAAFLILNVSVDAVITERQKTDISVWLPESRHVQSEHDGTQLTFPLRTRRGAPQTDRISSSFLYTTSLQQDWKRAFFIFFIPLFPHYTPSLRTSVPSSFPCLQMLYIRLYLFCYYFFILLSRYLSFLLMSGHTCCR